MRKLQTHVHADTKREAEVWFNPEYDEFVVKFFTTTPKTRNHQRGADYHTDDKQDAMGTAQLWIAQKE